MTRTTQRLYRGFCIHNAELPAAKQRFLDQEQAIYALLDNDERLKGSSRKKALKFLGKFFETLKDDKDFQRKIIDECRK